ncbi:MAG: hypothetical protein IBJ11_11965 [Phycisphaerales bacterium]|nr:hypothetical protein [Phycisphaerales bacterium]
MSIPLRASDGAATSLLAEDEDLLSVGRKPPVVYSGLVFPIFVLLVVFGLLSRALIDGAGKVLGDPVALWLWIAYWLPCGFFAARSTLPYLAAAGLLPAFLLTVLVRPGHVEVHRLGRRPLRLLPGSVSARSLDLSSGLMRRGLFWVSFRDLVTGKLVWTALVTAHQRDHLAACWCAPLGSPPTPTPETPAAPTGSLPARSP